jgi:hypothetical protein
MFKQEEFQAAYHKRSNVETTFLAIKRRFGSSVRSKTFTAQVNEILCKVLCHNRDGQYLEPDGVLYMPNYHHHLRLR